MKKLTALLLTLTMLVSVSTTALAVDAPNKSYPQRFYDVPKDYWAFGYIAELVDRGVLTGYEDGSFKPEDTVSRAEFAKIMVGAAGVQANDNSIYFSDMQNHWAIPYVNAAKDYLTAYADNTYRPDQAAVREDVTMAMVKLKGYDVSSADFSYLANFTDNNSISNNVKKYVAVAVEKGLISGFEDNTFRGQATLTRAEAATLLWRAFQYGNDNKVVEPSETIIEPSKSVEQPKATEKPRPTENPVDTSRPTAKPAIKPQPIATEEPTPIATEKPYKVDTLVKAIVNEEYNYGSYQFQTAYDGDRTLYYMENNHIYSLDINTKEKTDVLDIAASGLGDIGSICYDMYNNRLLLLENKGFSLVKSSYPVNLYELTDDGVKLVISEWQGAAPYGILNTTVDGNYIVSTRLYDLAAVALMDEDGDYMNGKTESAVAVYGGNNLQCLDVDSNAGPDAMNAVGANAVVGSDVYKMVIWFAGGYAGVGDMTAAEPNPINADECELADGRQLNFKNVHRKLYVTANNGVIFYDTTAKAFRMISEN